MRFSEVLIFLALMRKLELVRALYIPATSNVSSNSRKFSGQLQKITKARRFLSTTDRGYSSSRITVMQSTTSSSSTAAKIMASLVFDNRNLRDLPVDKELRNFPRQVKNAVSSRCQPTPVQSPDLIACSVDALQLLGLEVSSSQESASPDSLLLETKKTLENYFSGNKLFPGSEASAHCYCGHQFGNFAGQLGDGAAISLGEIMNGKERWELQIKGAGLTPFSRTADGRKVLRSSVREFLCSEAMHFLHIPTTRAATLVTSTSTVQRDPFYDGGVLDEKCTVVSRIAPNFFRFGSFEIFKGDGSRKGPSAGNELLKKQLLDHVLTYYPSIDKSDSDKAEKYSELYAEITRRTAELAARWQAVGFVHGVLNTDNMSIMGLTMDYGPFAFEEHFDPDFTPNGSDGGGRYTYAFQPGMCKWNLKKLAEQLAPLLSLSHSSEILNTEWETAYEEMYSTLMNQKLGLLSNEIGDKQLIEEYFVTLAATKTDFTDSFRALTDFSSGVVTEKDQLLENLVSRGASPTELIAMLRRKMKIHRLGMQPDQIQQLWDMILKNPEQVTEMFGGAPIEAIRAEIEGEKRNLDRQSNAYKEISRLQGVSPMQKVVEDRAIWEAWLTKYYIRLSRDGTSPEQNQLRIKGMKESNPTFVLRNWIAQDAIDAAEKGNYSEVNKILCMLRTPYAEEFSTFNSDHKDEKDSIVKRYTQTAPPGADGLICTCSS